MREGADTANSQLGMEAATSLLTSSKETLVLV